MRLKDWILLAAILYPLGLGCLTLAILLGGDVRLLTVGFLVYMSPVYLFGMFVILRPAWVAVQKSMRERGQ